MRNLLLESRLVRMGPVANGGAQPRGPGARGMPREGRIGCERGGRQCRNTPSAGSLMHCTAKRCEKEKEIAMRAAQALLLSRTNGITPYWFLAPRHSPLQGRHCARVRIGDLAVIALPLVANWFVTSLVIQSSRIHRINRNSWPKNEKELN